MRVLHVIGPLRTGGAQTQLLGLVQAAHGKLWDATVVATSGGTLAPEFAGLGCPFDELRRVGSPGLLRMRRLRQIVAGGEFDVVHGNLWQSNMYCRAAVYGRPDRPAVVISERNVEHERSLLRRILDVRLANVTDAYVGNTDAVGEFIRKVHPISGQPVVIIPNAVDRNIFHARASPPKAGGPITVGSIGRLDREKGFDVLIDAVRRLHDLSPIEVHIVGEGTERPQLERRAAGLPVRFRGSLRPGPDVAAFLRQIDVFVLPSTSREGRPNVILEALATGVPVVATDIAGMDEIIRGPTLVPPGDARALAGAIELAATDPDSWWTRSDAVSIPSFDDLATSYRQVFELAMTRLRTAASATDTEG